MKIGDGRPPAVARKRFYLGGPALVGAVYFFGHLYPWFRACLVRSHPAARDSVAVPGSRPPPLVSLPWCLLLTLDRLNVTGYVPPVDPALPSDRLSPILHDKTDGDGSSPERGSGQDQGIR
jgi:hypothetical protein